ncbi:PKD domain-containing protein [Halogeometricum borinquense]|nr:rej domain protein [Halogeometricum borinquense]
MNGWTPSASTRGQAESIGVVLLLGVVIVSASTFGFFYLTDGFSNDVSGGSNGASGESVNIAGEVSHDQLELAHTGGRSLSMDRLDIVVRNASGTTEYDFEPALIIAGDGDETFEAGERWRLDWNQPVGEKLRVTVVDADRNRILFSETLVIPTTPTPEPDNPARGETPTATPEDDGDPPSAVAHGGTVVGRAGETVTLDGSDTTDPDGDSLTYEWRIVDGDGLPPDAVRLVDDSTGTPNATFEVRENVTDRSHSVTVELVVSDGNDSARDRATVEVEKYNRPPEADAGEDDSVDGDVSDDDGDDSDDDDSDDGGDGDGSDDESNGRGNGNGNDRGNGNGRGNGNARTTWSIGSSVARPAELGAGSTAGPSTAPAGASGTGSRSFVVGGAAKRPTLVGGIAEVRLDGSGSYDPDGDDLTYRWEIVDTDGIGDILELSDRNAVRPVIGLTDVVLDRDRTVTVRLTVTDDDGATDTDTVNVTVRARNRAPVVSAIYGIRYGDEHYLYAETTDPDDDDLTYEWTYVGFEGASGDTWSLTDDSGRVARIEQRTDEFAAGRVIVDLTVTDARGESTTVRVRKFVLNFDDDWGLPWDSWLF